MEIIIPGDLQRAGIAVLFVCRKCGCQFIARKEEFEIKPGCRNDFYYQCSCPTCGYKCVQEGTDGYL